MDSENGEQLSAEIQKKLARCRDALRSTGKVVIAFSGGVDSTFLLALAVETLGSDNVIAGIGISPSLAQREREAARSLAETIGVKLIEVQTCELEDPDYAANPPERCFYCKQDLFTRLGELVRAHGCNALLCGANADDTADFRPGLRAGDELGVLNPLIDAGLTKADIRAASQVMGLETWDKPAMACLASRIPYGQTITIDKLSRIERAEYTLKDLGFRECRVRDHDSLARIEVPAEDIATLAADRDRIVTALKELGYTYVSLDLQGFRSGSMNEVITVDE